MKSPSSRSPSSPFSGRRTATLPALFSRVCAGLIVMTALILGGAPAWAQSTGRITGTVSHAITSKTLQGARIELGQTGKTTMTDDLGRFEFSDVAAGSYELTAAYTGLDSAQKSVTVSPGQRAAVAFKLESSIYRMETFQVTTEAEGNAAALTRQRSALNLINAASTDAFGSIANQNPGEVFMRLPGVTASVGEDNEVSGVAVRGMAGALNAVTMDGAILAPVASNATRQVRFTTNVSAQFDSFEVVKGITPDMDASSLGGTLHMKTKSPLSSNRDSEYNYRIGARWAPPFAPHNPLRRDRPIQPDSSAAYQGVFSVLGGHRNLGIAVNAVYFESVGDYIRTIRDYQSTNASPAFMWDYHAVDYFFNRHLKTMGARIDYQFSEATRLSVRSTVNDYVAFGGHLYDETRILTAQTVATLDAAGNPTGTGAILPGYTDTRTEARAVAGSQFQLIQNSVGQLQRQRTVQVVGEHKHGPWEFNFDGNLALGFLDQTSGQDTAGKTGGNFTSTISGVGWVLDSSRSREFPTFKQTGGPSVYDINNYRSNLMTQLGNSRHAHVYTAKLDARYTLPTDVTAHLKNGLAFRRQDSIQKTWNNNRFTYVGPDGVAGNADDSLAPFLDPNLRRTGEFGLVGVPFIHLGTLAQNLKDNPRQWVEDLYYRESQKKIGTNSITEDVSAAYLMGDVKLGKLSILGGARFEQTNLHSTAWVIPRTLATIADPFARVAAEYVSRSISGDYSSVMPSLHLNYALQPRLIARASFSTGVSRPPFANLVPIVTANDTARTITTANPDLVPQNANNWDFSLEYYMKQLGQASIGLFQKDLRHFIFTSQNGVVGTGVNNGYNGQYEGYGITTNLNGGNARVRGLELNYQQQFDFGPKWLRSFGMFANYTRLNTRGDYGTGTTQPVASLAEFVPTSWNVGAHYSYRAFRLNYLFNNTGRYLFTYSTNAARLLYKQEFKNTTLSLSYALKPAVEIYCDAYNLLNQPQRWYYGVPSHLQEYSRKGMILSFGVRGRF